MASQYQLSRLREILKHQTWYVGDTKVKVLLDTGCELNDVQKDLMSEDQMHDKRFVMITIGGQQQRLYRYMHLF